MKKKIKIEDIKIGMQFTSPVYFGTQVVIPAFTPVKISDLERLKRWRVSEVEVDDEEVVKDIPSARPSQTVEASVSQEEEKKEKPDKRKELAERLKKYAADVKKVDTQISNLPKSSDAASLAIITQYTKILSLIKNILQDIKIGQIASKNEIYDIIGEIIDLATNKKTEILSILSHFEDPAYDYLVVHSANVCIYSTLIGYYMNLNQYKLNQLAIASLLHDVGMMKVPENIINKKEKLTPTEFIEIQKHTIEGYKILSQKQNFTDEICQVALQHHERFNGSGYPAKRHGDQITQFSKIVAVADSYDAMTEPHTYKEKFHGHRAIKDVLQASKNLYDPEVSKTFLSIMSIYPIGSLVQFNDGSIGIVIQANPNLPLRPTVKIIVDEFGDRVPDRKIIDLEKNPNLFITSIINPKELNFQIEEYL
ncbi:MAG TPA: HD-GYP domain-containing protein [Exilispira sp.]|nr:HD-GYP domain-containing protein [Exilispira sp.]